MFKDFIFYFNRLSDKSSIAIKNVFPHKHKNVRNMTDYKHMRQFFLFKLHVYNVKPQKIIMPKALPFFIPMF